jgi:hypothetical protein
MRISRWGGLSQWDAFLSRAFIGQDCITWPKRILLIGCLSENNQVKRIITVRCLTEQTLHWLRLCHMTGKDTADWLPKWEYPGEEDYHSEWLGRAIIGQHCITWLERILLIGCLSENIHVRRIIIMRCLTEQTLHWSKLYHMIRKRYCWLAA